MTTKNPTKKWLAAAAISLLCAGSASAVSDGWLTDLAAAKKQAAEKEIDIFMNFTGSDWWGGCIQLEKRVFSKKEFVDASGKNFVLLEVDFPNGKEQPAELKAQNAKLAQEFAIQAYPTLMLCDAKGRPYAEAGFPDEMKPESMSKLLEERRKVKAKRDEAFAKAEKAEGVEKAKLLVQALAIVPAAAVPSAYGDCIDEIAKLDPEDKTGFVKKARTQQAMAKLESGFGELMEAGKTDEAVKHIDDFLTKHKPEGEAKQKAMMLKMFGLATAEKFPEAIKLADEIIKIDGSSETGNMVKQIKKQLEQQ